MQALLTLIGAIALIGSMLIYTTASWGWLIYKFWYWFLLPVFPQMPHISFAQALGIMMFLTLFKNHNSEGIKDEYKEDKWQRTSSILLMPWISLLIGYFVWMYIR